MQKKLHVTTILLLIVALFSVYNAKAQSANQVLRIATASSGQSSFDFNTLSAGGDQQNWTTLQYVPPMYFDADLKLQPGLFKAWESNKEGTVWKFTLDPRAKWSDGSKITAKQVVASWQIQVAPLNAVGRITGYLGNVAGFAEARAGAAKDAITVDVSGLKALDDANVQVSLVKPDPAFHWRIATAHMSVAYPDNVLKFGYNEYWKPANNPIVNGPYILTAYDENNQTAEMGPNSNWWMDTKPQLSKITFQFVPDQQIIGAMVLNDQIDASLAPIPSALRSQVPDYFRPIKVIGFNVFWLRPSAEPTNDVNVRKALILSVDWNAVFKATFPVEGSGVMTTQPMDDVLNCWDPKLTGYPYDVAGAKAALAASSYGSADKLPKIRVTPRGSDEFNNRALQAVMEFWRQNLGITNVEFQQLPAGFGDDITKLNITRDDVVIRFPDGATYMWNGAHSAGPNVNGKDTPLETYKNTQLETLIDKALTLSPDDPERCNLTRQAQDLYINDYVMGHFGKPVATINARKYVEGYNKGPDVSLIEPWKIRINR
jgi:peptide/nickel transport system substrate-binding protein